MDECAKNCKHLKVYEDEVKDYETAETGGYCVELNKMVYFGVKCLFYEPKEEQKE